METTERARARDAALHLLNRLTYAAAFSAVGLVGIFGAVSAATIPATSTATASPSTSYYRTFWLGLGVICFELLLAIVLTSLVRGFLGHRAWRAVHWLTYASWPVGVLHGVGTGTDTWSAWMLAITAACVAAVGVAIVLRMTGGSRDPLAAPRSTFRTAVDRREPQ